MRALSMVLIGCTAIAVAGTGWYFFGRSQEATGPGAMCRVVSFEGATVSGTAKVCLRCLSGRYSATIWTNCATTPSKEKPGQVECSGTPVDPGALCAVTNSPDGSAAAIPTNDRPVTPTTTEPSSGTPPVVGDASTPPLVTAAPPVAQPPSKVTTVAPPSTAVVSKPPPKPPTVVIGKTRSGGPSEDELYGGALAPGERGVDGNRNGGGYAYVVGSMAQGEERDYYGRLTREAATIWVVACPNKRQIYVFQYANRLAFRAILPPDWGHPLGGGDFTSYELAVRAGCGS